MNSSCGRRPVLFLLAIATAPMAAAAQASAPVARTFNFDGDPAGSPPSGFLFARTGEGEEGRWVVRPDPASPKNHVLVQESHQRLDYRYPLALVAHGEFRDVRLSVRARTVSGELDQGFGLVWRYKDPRNYYVARCNANEDNCRIYRVVGGSRHLFQDRSVPVSKRAWHVLKVEARSERFVVWFDGTKVLDATDDTFRDAGGVGLWTKADSVIEFDDFTVEPDQGTAGEEKR